MSTGITRLKLNYGNEFIKNIVFFELKCSVLDVDECEKGIANCQQICINTVGGFNCECEFGYALDDVKRKTCEEGIKQNFIEIILLKACAFLKTLLKIFEHTENSHDCYFFFI